MPELPDIEIYCAALASRVVGSTLLRLRVFSPSLLRTFAPAAKEFEGDRVAGVSRLGKRVVLEFESGRAMSIHLMISGRLLWSNERPSGLRPGGKSTLAIWEFEGGGLTLTEASTKHRAGLWLLPDRTGLRALDPGGIDPFSASFEQFELVLRSENRTLKRMLANPRAFSGIGNAYSDEILWEARFSPLRLTRSLSDEEVERLRLAVIHTLQSSLERLQRQFGENFPGKGQITAFRPEFAVHGRYGQPCPRCAKPVQRIRYAENETNYCAQCQNEGRLLADRALSQLLKGDWPKTLEELMAD